jgi:hypothetical protein
MSFKIKITSKLDQEGNLHYNREKLRKFFNKLNSSSPTFTKEKDVGIYLVHKLRDKIKNSEECKSIRQRRISNFAQKVQLDDDHIELLLSSQGSIKNKKFFETVEGILKSE